MCLYPIYHNFHILPRLLFYDFSASAQPYILHVVTDDNEDEDEGNLGFEINFRQNLCYS